MRRLVLLALLTALTLPLAAVSHSSHHSSYSGHGLSVSVDDWEDVRDCSALHVRYNERDVPVVEENVAVGSLRSLKVRGDRNGSIRVVPSNTSSFAMKACKASALGNVNDLHVNLSGNEVSADRIETKDAPSSTSSSSRRTVPSSTSMPPMVRSRSTA